MTTDLYPATSVQRAGDARPDEHPEPGRGLLRDLQSPLPAFSYLTPNWFAAVMGTGIVAVAASSLPWSVPGLRVVAIGFWLLAVALLLVLAVGTVLHWRLYPSVARGHAADPVMSHFYGAPPMAVLTIGAGALLVGRDVVGSAVAVDLDWVLWSSGTITGLVVAVAVPYRVFARGQVSASDAFGGWLMPVVPPMVSASTGALLVPYVAPGPSRLSLLLACYAMFGLALIASLVVITAICRRLAIHGVGPARLVPTLWIVLGPLGQSITAANLLGGVAHLAVPATYADALQTFGVVYGVPVLGVALLWAVIAGAITIRTARDHLPFSLTWWSFTFPVGTCVTGTSALFRHTAADLFRVSAMMIFAVMLVAWVTVGTRTAVGVGRGQLLINPAP